MKGNHYIQIKIKNTRKVIDYEHVRRLFDPVITSQERGSKIGLAGAYSSLIRNDGYLTVTSTPEEGTEFTITLPASAPPVPVQVAEEGLNNGGGRKVLVMDDDELICNLVETMLKQLEYTSETALDGERALAMYEAAMQSGAPYDVVIMDLIIAGGMGGRETMEKLLRIDPQAKVIISSGYINNSIMREYRRYGFSDVMEKPYRFSQLHSTLQRVLASRTTQHLRHTIA